MKRLVIDKRLVSDNLSVIKTRAGSAQLYAVLTADGHGAGLLEMAKLLRQEGITRFAIAEPQEARALRKAGFVEEELLMLRSTVNRDELEQLVDLNVVCSVGSSEAGMALNALAESRSTVAEAHIQVDCGMGYGGFVVSEGDKVVSAFQNLQNIAISGIYTHLASAGEKALRAQLDEFEQLVQEVRRAGFETGVVHASVSFPALGGGLSWLDAVRVGPALLGRCKGAKGEGLQRVGFCEATVEDVRWLPAGHSVGGEHPVRLKKPTRVATLAVGYQNGLGLEPTRPGGLWAALRRWRGKELPAVRLEGKKVKIIGRVGALETLIDVTGLKCAPGDWVRLELDPLYAKGMPREYR